MGAIGIPAFAANPDGSVGMLPRQCTADFKLAPLRRKAKELAGIRRGEKEVRVIQWIGITTDEGHRMKPSREAWCRHRWPLVELDMTRKDCLAWMQANGYPAPPRSACVFCPYHSDQEWLRLKTEQPLDFAQAVAFETAWQAKKAETTNRRSTPFLHRSLKPLAEVDFTPKPMVDQRDPRQREFTVGGFGNECEGLCGV